MLENDARFEFDEACKFVFEEFKGKLVISPIMATLDWSKEFENMRDANDYAMGAILGQRKEKIFRVIYYVSKTLNEA